MTMDEMRHPDDERLAAFAGGDFDATDDRELRGHIDGCPRCSALVTEVARLRAALAEMPDVVPPHPLRLLPPVDSPAERRMPWYRRLIAPAVAMGGVMVLVGAVGLAGGSIASQQPALSAQGGQESSGQAGERSLVDALFGAAAADRQDRAIAEDANGENGPEPAAGAPSRAPSRASPLESDSGSPPPADYSGADTDNGGWPGWPTLPLVLLGSGVALLGGGLVIRFAILPRAG